MERMCAYMLALQKLYSMYTYSYTRRGIYEFNKKKKTKKQELKYKSLRHLLISNHETQ